MELKTKLYAEAGRQDLTITRDFELPVELVFRAYTEADLFAQWMSTRVKTFECKTHGSYRFETCDPQGKVVFSANGTIHACVPNRQIVRTFEMENTGFPVQLEFLDFEALSGDTSRLTMHIVYKSVAVREQVLAMPFAQGLNMAHNRLQQIFAS